MLKLDLFTRSYITAALWTSLDTITADSGTPLAFHFVADDLAPAALEAMISDCAQFQATYWSDIQDTLDRAGAAFWFTRNRCGAGFAPGVWGIESAVRLREAAEAYGEADLVVGDDGLIWLIKVPANLDG